MRVLKMLSLVAALVLTSLGLTFLILNRTPAPDLDQSFVDLGPELDIRFLSQNIKDPGPNYYGHGAGVCIFDANGDDRMDVLLLQQLGMNGFFIQQDDGRFREEAMDRGVGYPDRVPSGASAADYDGDGDVDLFIGSYRGGNVLLRNDGGGWFDDVSREAGVEATYHTAGSTWLDYDRDGDLDLFVVNLFPFTGDEIDPRWGYHVAPPMEMRRDMMTPAEPCLLYRNDGSGHFTEVAQSVGAAVTAMTIDVAAGDYDRDGWVDLYVTNLMGRDALLRNDQGRFTDVTLEAMGSCSFGTFGAAWTDHNGDGFLDLVGADMHSDMWVTPDIPVDGTWDPLAKFDHHMHRKNAKDGVRFIAGNSLFVNQRDGTFVEISDEAGIESFWPWGASPADFDRDGDTDLFMVGGMGFPWKFWPNALFMNNGDGTYTDRDEEYGIDPPRRGRTNHSFGMKMDRSSRTAAIGDLDDDGAVDIVINMWLDQAAVLLNRLPERYWIGFSLRGSPPNTDGLGAIVTIRSAGTTQVRHRLSAQGYLVQNDPRLLFGLGDSKTVDSVEVLWPSGVVRSYGPLQVGRYHVLHETPGA